MLNLIPNTKIEVGETVVVYTVNKPQYLGKVIGGTSKVLTVQCPSGLHLKFNRNKGRNGTSYLNKNWGACLYFLGEPSHTFR